MASQVGCSAFFAIISIRKLNHFVTPRSHHANYKQVGIAFAAYFVLPNFPRTTSWLSQEERELAIWRLEEDIGADDWVDSQHQSFMVGLKLAFSDVKTYILMVLLFGIGKLRAGLKGAPLIYCDSGWRHRHEFLPVCPSDYCIKFKMLILPSRTVVQTLGYGTIPTLLLTCPPYVLAVITTFLNSWHAGMKFAGVTPLKMC